MKTSDKNYSGIPADFRRAASLLFAVLPVFFTACINDGPVKYNRFSIEKITTPVKSVTKSGNSGKKVYIGHSLPVNVDITAEYSDENVPVQVYLLNVNDVEAVEAGSASVDDIRFYYCHQTDETKIARIEAGTKSYGIVINIPAGQSRDEYTGDFKIGNYYVLGEINKYDGAETDIYKVYQAFKDKIDPDNTIVVASDYMSKPDLSVEAIHFTGTTSNPRDSVSFYDLDLSKLPGLETTNLGKIYLKPDQKSRTFTGSVDVKSSASDALNVPVRFYLESTDSPATISVPLEIYDKSMEGYVDEYYIPILRKNTKESVTLMLRIPDDTGPTDYFTKLSTTGWNENEWVVNETNKDLYPLFQLRYKMLLLSRDPLTESEKHNSDYYPPVYPGQGRKGGVPSPYIFRNYKFKIRAEINPDARISERRFIQPNSDNGTYTTDNYIENGNNPLITKINNSKTEDLILAVTTIDVKADSTTKYYPCSVIDVNNDGSINDADCALNLEQRKLAIWWGGFQHSTGNKQAGAAVSAHSGLMFWNYSLISWGFNLNFYISDIVPAKNVIDFKGGVKVNFTAESHPFDSEKSYYEFITFYCGGLLDWGDENDWWQGNARVLAFKDYNKGFDDYDLNTPITFDRINISFDTEVAGVGINCNISSGIYGVSLIPRSKIKLVEDGSLRYDLGTSLDYGFVFDVGASGFDLVTAGINGGFQLFTFDFGFQILTRTYYDESGHKGKVKGDIGLGSEIWFTGPQGKFNFYFSLLGVKVEIPILSFQSFKVPVYDDVFSPSLQTNWTDVENADDIKYDGLKTSADVY